MGPPCVYIKVITNGKWKSVGTRWIYAGINEGNPDFKALVIPEDAKVDDIKNKLYKELNIDEAKQVANIEYLYKDDLPPISINDEDDWESFKFLNSIHGDPEWSLELYTYLVDVVAAEESDRTVRVAAAEEESDVPAAKIIETDKGSNVVKQTSSQRLRALLHKHQATEAESSKRKRVIRKKDIIILRSDEEDLE